MQTKFEAKLQENGVYALFVNGTAVAGFRTEKECLDYIPHYKKIQEAGNPFKNMSGWEKRLWISYGEHADRLNKGIGNRLD